MSVTVAASPLTSAAQLAALPDDGAFFYELDQGDLIIMAPAGEEHGSVEGELFGLLHAQVRARGLGKLYPSDTGFVLSEDPDTVRSPDVAFVRKERLPLPTHRSGYILGAPDIAVEIRSPSQPPADLERKTQQYLEAGAKYVWVLDPKRRQAVVWERGVGPRTLDAGDVLEAPDLLPGVSVPLRDVFKPEPKQGSKSP